MTFHSRDHRLETPTKKPRPRRARSSCGSNPRYLSGPPLRRERLDVWPEPCDQIDTKIPENRVQRVRSTGEQVNYVQDLRRTNLIPRFLTQPPVTRVGYVGTPDSLGLSYRTHLIPRPCPDRAAEFGRNRWHNQLDRDIPPSFPQISDSKRKLSMTLARIGLHLKDDARLSILIIYGPLRRSPCCPFQH